MKKFLAVVVATLVAVSALATFIPSFAAIGTEDLLEESGLGDPEFIAEEGIAVNGATWLGHESWNSNQGWDGFKGFDDVISTAEVVETTLSNGSEGYAIRFANDNESGNSGSQFGIENIDKICDFEEGKSYIAKATVKVSGDRCNGHYSFIAFNCGECTLHGGNATDIDHTGAWQTVYSPVFKYVEENLTADGAGAYLSICFGENWISPGYEMLIEKVEVFELVTNDKDILDVNGLGNPLTTKILDNNDTVNGGLGSWSGWIQYVGDPNISAISNPTRTIENVTLPDGSTGPAVVLRSRYSDNGVHCHVAYNNALGINGLEPSTEYTLKVTVKFTSEDMTKYVGGVAKGVWGMGEGVGVCLNEVWTSDFFKEEDNGQWVEKTLTFTTPADLTADTIVSICVGNINGETYGFDGFTTEIAGASLMKSSDVVDTGDTTAVFAVAFVVLLCAAAVVLTKKRVSDR